jgi:hypothetical protein
MVTYCFGHGGELLVSLKSRTFCQVGDHQILKEDRISWS